MKKTFIFLVLACLVQQAAFSQDNKQRAKTYFERAFYGDAIPLYEELAKTNKSSEVVKNLADSYYNTYQLPKAAKWYSYLTSVYADKVDESYFFKYSQTLKAIGEYEEATKVLMDFYAGQGDTAKVDKLKEELRHLDNVNAIGDRFELENLALNTENSEFGAVKVDSVIIYAASMKKALPGVNKVYRWNGQNYLDLYAHSVDNLKVGDSVSVSYSKNINTKKHEAIVAVTKDRSTIYFTRNNYIKGKKGTDGNKVSNLKIYQAKWVKGKWDDITELPFNSDEYSTEHPALDADGKTLYFASDREGSYGSFDIYSVAINDDGSFGEPKNLGPEINSEKKEQFPYLDAENNLYFSSNGHAGFGLLDVFVAKNNNGKFEKPDNIGKPVNGGYDDFAYYLNEEGTIGFVSSNRPTGKGSDDIYQFNETKPLLIEDCKQSVTGILLDKTTQEPLPFGKVNLLDADGKILKTITTGENAQYDFSLACTTSYKIEGEKDAYQGDAKLLTTSKKRDAVNEANLQLYSDIEKYKEESRQLQKKLDEEKIAEKKRIERAKLAEKERIAAEKAEEEKRVKAEIAAKEKAKKEKEDRIEKAIAKEPAIVREGKRIVIKAEPKIYFDYDLWYIRLKSKETLDEIVRILKENPGIILEIGTHTDIRGNDDYNKDLSQKRSNSVVEYLLENGINKKRLTSKGYGESKTIVKCATEEACTEEQHEINRRCEFVITSWE